MSSLSPNPAGYRAYLLRMWRTASGDWRGTLESPHIGERRGFASLDELLAFLADETSAEVIPEQSSAETQAE